MNSTTLALVALAMVLGVALGDYGYGSLGGLGGYGGGYGGGYTYVPVTGGYGGAGLGQGGLLMLIGLLFVLLFLFNPNNLNTTTTVQPNITIG